jgi:hypothetical protein
MAFKIEWKPVLQALPLSDYHPEYADNTIMVCVNPKPEFMKERDALMAEYSKRLLKAQAAAKKADNGELADKAAAEATTAAFSEWSENVFLAGMQDWFARLWSFGEEKFSLADLNEYEQLDPHLTAWLKRRSMEMIEEHRIARKKA